MPGGYNSSNPDQGMATMVSKPYFQIFVICDTIALYSSMIVAVSLIWAQLGDLNLILTSLRLALPLLGNGLCEDRMKKKKGISFLSSFPPKRRRFGDKFF